MHIDNFNLCYFSFSISNEALIVALWVLRETSIIYSNNLKQTNLFGYWLIFLFVLLQMSLLNKLYFMVATLIKTLFETLNLKVAGIISVKHGNFPCILRFASPTNKNWWKRKQKWERKKKKKKSLYTRSAEVFLLNLCMVLTSLNNKFLCLTAIYMNEWNISAIEFDS